MKKKNKRTATTVKLIIVIAVLLGSIAAWDILRPVSLHNGKAKHIYVHQGDSFDQISDSVAAWNLFRFPLLFKWGGEALGLPSRLHAGHYEVQSETNMLTIWKKLRRGNQDPVQYRLLPVRMAATLAEKAAEQLAFSPEELQMVLADSLFLAEMGTTPTQALMLFTPNTYEMWWNISPREYVRRMAKETESFWEQRKEPLSQSGLNQRTVLTIASIVDEETSKNDEKARIAGVYINRLRKGMRLQADPTVKYALQDFSLKRINSTHTAVQSPYNTYKYAGIPPTPINIPSVSAIDAVLHYERHPFMFFCAKSDFSGYHSFAKTFEEHRQNAQAYQRELNRKNIH